MTSCVYSIDKKGDAPEPCVETHDRGCVLEPEFEALVEEVAGEYAEPSSFQNQWGLEAINADQAYANLELQLGPDAAPGEGVTVGVLDTGIDGADPAFRDKTVIERFLSGATEEDGTDFSHGTAVASVIAGEDIPDYEFDAQGVAWGADLIVFAIPLGDPPELYDPIKLSELPERRNILWRPSERCSLAVRLPEHRFSELEPRCFGNHRELQRRGSSRTFRGDDYLNCPGRLRRESRLCLGRGKCERQGMRYPDTPVRWR